MPAEAWDALDPSANPFLRHAFLEALESSDCVGGDTGWIPRHLVLRDDGGRLVGAVPQYLKLHSWGEFIFDWSWAQSYARAGLDYYPKLLSAVPFTPVTGPRLLLGPDADPELRRALARLLIEAARQAGASGAHVNFTDRRRPVRARAGRVPAAPRLPLPVAQPRLPGLRRLPRRLPVRQAQEGAARAPARRGSRHDFPHAAGRGHRRRAVEDDLRVLGAHVPAPRQRALPERRISSDVVARRMPESIMVKLAERHGTPVAAAIFFQGGGRLYGRYWGAAENVDSLHFEACYYQGIEYCIEHGLETFDPGTQGEHKLARGFEPTLTWSAHWLAHDGFGTAIGALPRARTGGGRRLHRRCGGTPAVPARDPGVIPWLPRTGAARRVPAGQRGAAGAGRPAVRRRRPVAGSPARGLPARHLSLVLRGAADPVVVAGSTRRCCFRASSSCRAAWPRPAAIAGSKRPSTGHSPT